MLIQGYHWWIVDRSGQQKELTLTEFFWTDLCSTTTANKAFCAFSRALHWTVLQVPCSRTEICNRFLSSSFDLVFTLVRIVQQGTLNWTCKHVVFVVIFVLSAVTCLKRHIDGLRVKQLNQGCIKWPRGVSHDLHLVNSHRINSNSSDCCIL